MDTRSKSKLSIATNASMDNAPPQALSQSQNPSKREEELLTIERSMQEKQERLNAQEKELRLRFEKLDTEKHMLDRERDTFIQNIAAREQTLVEKEREIDKRWAENSDIINLDPSRQPYIPPLVNQCPYEMSSMNRSNNGHGDNTPKISFRDAIDSVPFFNGYNIPLAQFTRACRRAREIIPPSAEANLTKLLVSKLYHRAYYAVEDEPCSTVTELVDLLTGAFGSPKTLDQYRGELSTIYLTPNEHVLDYISRVKDLRTNILDIERRNKGRIDSHFLEDIDNLTARSFCEGLPLEYRLQIGPEARRLHTDAFAAAKAIAKRQELDKQRNDPRYRPNRDDKQRYEPRYRPDREDRLKYELHYRPDREDKRRYEPRYRPEREDKPRYEPRFRSDRERAYTSVNPIGRPLAHSTPESRPNPPRRDTSTRAYDSRPGTPPKEPGRYRPNENRRDERATEKYCRYCKRSGHEIEECRRREYNNTRAAEAGNSRSPPGRPDTARADEPRKTRPMNPITSEEGSEPESQC